MDNNELEFNKAPRENLDAYAGMIKAGVWSTVSIAIVLLIMAATLTG